MHGPSGAREELDRVLVGGADLETAPEISRAAAHKPAFTNKINRHQRPQRHRQNEHDFASVGEHLGIKNRFHTKTSYRLSKRILNEHYSALLPRANASCTDAVDRSSRSSPAPAKGECAKKLGMAQSTLERVKPNPTAEFSTHAPVAHYIRSHKCNDFSVFFAWSP